MKPAYLYKSSKSKSNKTTIDGIEFKSTNDANSYLEKKILFRAGKISEEEFKKEIELLSGNSKTKYKATKRIVDGITFDSSKEANRYLELKLLLRAGKISDLEMQKEFVLIPTQREPSTFTAKGKEVPGKVIEKKCSYYADFCYKDESGNLVVEDTKGMRTTDYIIKRKLMLYVHGIRIHEI